MTDNMVLAYESEDGSFKMWHKDGVAWNDAPLPPRWHRCKVQTRGYDRLELIERCACGATRFDGGGVWVGKNETRDYRKRHAA